jgi:ornithine cyclodeaminase/alanine dehydrogenase-like protein (mu-crystallin family)
MLALMDAHYLTAVRTRATTGIATKYLAKENAKTVGIIGSGLEARTNLEAVCAVRRIEKVKVFSPTVARRELYASEMSAKYDLEVKAAPSPDAAEEGVDIVIVATNTGNGGIAFEGKWMRKGMHVNSIVATMPVLREIDADSFARADSIAVDTMQIEEESGDVLDALKNGKYDRSKVIELKDLIGCSARDTAEQITLFKSVGTAVQDIMAGRAVFEEAKRLKLGTDVGDLLELKQMK